MKSIAFYGLVFAGLVFVSCGKSPENTAPQAIEDIDFMQKTENGDYDVRCADGSFETASEADLLRGNVCGQSSQTLLKILSMVKRDDGKFDVICLDMSREIATALEIQRGDVCLKPDLFEAMIPFGAETYSTCWIQRKVENNQSNVSTRCFKDEKFAELDSTFRGKLSQDTIVEAFSSKGFHLLDLADGMRWEEADERILSIFVTRKSLHSLEQNPIKPIQFDMLRSDYFNIGSYVKQVASKAKTVLVKVSKPHHNFVASVYSLRILNADDFLHSHGSYFGNKTEIKATKIKELYEAYSYVLIDEGIEENDAESRYMLFYQLN